MSLIELRRSTALLLALAAFLVAGPPVVPSAGTSYYVSAAGSDSNSCSAASPCRQIRRALALVAPGDTILVADGSYLGFDVDDIHGTAAAPITIKAEGTGAQVLRTTDRSDNQDTILVTSSSYVVIEGLRSFGANRAAVRVERSPFVTIRNGVFGNSKRWGIFSAFSDDLVLEGNECFGSQLEHGIYVSSSGDRPIVRANRVHDNAGSGIQLNADPSAGGDGLITGALIENNVAYNNGALGGAAIDLAGVQDSIVRNNLLYNNGAAGIVNHAGESGAGPKGIRILHNTVDMPAKARGALLFKNTAGSNLVRNNILYSHSRRGGIVYGDATDAANVDSDFNLLDRVSVDDGNSVLTLAQWRAQGQERHSFSAPDTTLWVNAAAADYHLRTGSPAIDRAPALAAVPADIDSAARPSGAGADLGAYEVTVSLVPPGFNDTVYVSGLSSPTAMDFAPDGRLFVCEQGGKLRVVKNGSLLATPFVTLTVSSVGERGLLGIAFDPSFASNQFLYVYYTATTPAIHNRISRFTANGDVAVPGSELVLLDLDNLSGATNHNGGAIHFGPDGKLYAAVGENANGNNSQTLANLLGKMLRINSDGTIPTDNPYYNQATGKNRAIWTLGLRNPFTFAFQPGTGRMFINDVGASTWEEINDGIAGSNYGWPATEGPTTNPLYRSPLFWYGHGGGNTLGCAITGGAFYNPQTAQFPSDYVDEYFFADYCNGWIRRWDPVNGIDNVFGTSLAPAVDLKVTNDGSLYYLAYGNGSVHRVQYAPSQVPVITSHPSSVTVSVGQPASFSVSATGAMPLSYQWQRNGVNIAGATSTTYTIASAQLSDNGAQFRCVVTNSFGSATSNSATLTVTSNTPPTATINQPPSGTLYAAGDTINYSGTGTDPEDGTLPPSAFTWQVDFHHDTHVHPFIPPTTGASSGSFVIPNTGETSANVWYRIYLTVKDSGNLTHTTQRDILPRVVTLTVTTNPVGLQVLIDSQPNTAPVTFQGVVGMLRQLDVISPQTQGANTWVWASWSDGGAQNHTIVTPSVNTTYTATFSAAPPPPAEPVAWTSLVGVSANGGTLTKTASTGWGNAGAISTKGLASGDGYVEVRATQTNTSRIFGLSNGDTNQTPSDIDFGIHLGASGRATAREKGVSRGPSVKYLSGVKLRVEVVSGVVKYSRNGVVFYTSLVAPTYPLLVDSALYTQGATLDSAMIFGGWNLTGSLLSRPSR